MILFYDSDRMSATLLLGDCLEIMKTLPDKSVDCFVCDLPYGQLTGGAGKEKTKRKERNSNDVIAGCVWDIKLNLELFWKEVKRLCRDDHTPVLMFCNTKFGYELIKSNEDWFRYDLVWDKGRGVSFLLANKMPMKSHEMVYVFSKKGTFYKRIDAKSEYKMTTKANKKSHASKTEHCVVSVIHSQVVQKKKGNHPTEKPKELYEWLLRRYAVDGGTVLDPTAGSFNSIDVAKQLGLKGIGIEKDEGFFHKAMERFIGSDGLT